MSKNNQAAIRP